MTHYGGSTICNAFVMWQVTISYMEALFMTQSPRQCPRHGRGQCLHERAYVSSGRLYREHSEVLPRACRGNTFVVCHQHKRNPYIILDIAMLDSQNHVAPL